MLLSMAMFAGALAIGCTARDAPEVGHEGRAASPSSPGIGAAGSSREEARRALELDLARIAAEVLPEAADGAAVMDLADGALVLVHHPAAILERPLLAGSVQKLFTAYAILEAEADPSGPAARGGRSDPSRVGSASEARGERSDRGRVADPALSTCTGSHTDRRGVERPCWLRPGHGEMRLRTALAHSCNVYFYARSEALPPEALVDVLRRFGFGAASEEGVARDVLPARIAARDLPDFAVGDHDGLQVTPLALLRAVALIATRGRLDPLGHGAPSRAELAPAYLELIAEGMAEAVQSGTLAQLFGGAPVAAKTGTARRSGARGTRGLVVGFAPVDAPRWAFVVLKERGRGAIDAGPPAAALAKRLLGGEDGAR